MRPRARPPVPITPMRMRSLAPWAEAGAGRHPDSRAVVAASEVPRNRRRLDGGVLPGMALSGLLIRDAHGAIAAAETVVGPARAEDHEQQGGQDRHGSERRL